MLPLWIAREEGFFASAVRSPGLHNMIVEDLSMPAALKEKLKPILAPKG